MEAMNETTRRLLALAGEEQSDEDVEWWEQRRICLACPVKRMSHIDIDHQFEGPVDLGPWPPDLANEQRLNFDREHC